MRWKTIPIALQQERLKQVTPSGVSVFDCTNIPTRFANFYRLSETGNGMTASKMHELTRDQILLRIADYLHENIDRPIPTTLSATTCLVKDLQLDSMEGAQMLTDLEDHYSVTIAVSVLQRAETLGDVAAVVMSALEAGKRE